jgi:hypothetical protein
MGFLNGGLGGEEGALVGERSHNRQLELARCDPTDTPSWQRCCAVQPRWAIFIRPQGPEMLGFLPLTIMKTQVFCRTRLRVCAPHRTLDL